MYVVVALLVLACIHAIGALLYPPYTDQQIQASVVDTWQVEALVTTATLALLFCALILSVIFAYMSKQTSTRMLATIAVFLSLMAGVIEFSAHVALTKRTTQLTGQTFGSAYGLF